ncbi:MAG: hypothetical protein HWD63_07120 [Candidatus Parvibacillus calidus]|nr:MAG: hypothetical protein HWD63_07120 [Candidatus Parvibacillus calidus]
MNTPSRDLPSLVSALTGHYGNRESENILRILYEDYLILPRKTALEDIPPSEVIKLKAALDLLLKDYPIQYITGKVWFYGYLF